MHDLCRVRGGQKRKNVQGGEGGREGYGVCCAEYPDTDEMGFADVGQGGKADYPKRYGAFSDKDGNRYGKYPDGAGKAVGLHNGKRDREQC